MSPQRRKYQVLVRSRGSLHTPARRLHRPDPTDSFCSLDDGPHETPHTRTRPHTTKLFREPRSSKPSNRNDLSASSRTAQPPDFFDLYPSSDQGSCLVDDPDRRPVIVADGHLRDKAIKALYGAFINDLSLHSKVVAFERLVRKIMASYQGGIQSAEGEVREAETKAITAEHKCEMLSKQIAHMGEMHRLELELAKTKL